MKAPITAFLLSLGISLNLNLNNHVSSSEIIELDSSSPSRTQIDLELDLDLDSTKPSRSRSSFTPPDERIYHKVKSSRARRMAEQRDRVREKIASGEFAEKYHRITEEQLINLVDNAYEEDPDLNKAENQWIRRGNLKESLNDPRRRDLWLWGIIQRDIRDPYEIDSGEADISADWDKWAQGYRHIGDFVDCSDMFGRGGGGSHDSGSGDRAHKCNRWAAWCAYVDPYYAGGGYDEYFGNDAKGKLDCHVPSTKWLLLGCYAQELYQWYEQISKHLWAIDDYNYVVAVAGLAYMTDENCKGPYYDTYNNEVYFGVMPLESGKMMMGAYSDDQCIYPNEKTTATYDDFFEGSGGNNDNEQYQGQDYQYQDQNQNNEEYQYQDQGQDQDQNQNDIANEDDGGNKDQGQDQDQGDEARQLSEWWGNAQEYTMTLFNEVYGDYLYCTSCMDYPTYQDGYFIGDDGTDDEDLINQCWKFYSHDSFNLPVDGMAQAAMQGGLTAVAYRGAYFGTSFDGQYRSWYINDQKSRSQKAATYQKQQRIERLKANLFLTFSGIIYVATVLVFAVARGSSKKMKSSSRSRSRRLLDADYDGGSVDRSAKSSDGRSHSSSAFKAKAKASSSSNRSKSCNRKSEDGDYYKAPSPDCDSDMARTRSESRSRTRTRKSSTSSSSSVLEIEYMYANAD